MYAEGLRHIVSESWDWQCCSEQLQDEVVPLATATFQLPPHINGQQGKNFEQQKSNNKGSFFSTNNLLWLCGLGGIVYTVPKIQATFC